MARKLFAVCLTTIGSIWCAVLLLKSSFDPYTAVKLCPGVALIASGALLWWRPRMRPRVAALAFACLWSLLGGVYLWSAFEQSEDLVVAFTSRSVDLASGGDPADAANRARVALRVCGEVVSVSAPLVESPSILGARYRAKIVLDETARIADWRGRRLEFHYDKYGLASRAPQRGDSLCFYFDAEGHFLDVLPSRSRLARELEDAEDSR